MKLTQPSSASKLILGTAMWGWTMNSKQCFQILDTFYQKGGREVDTATNYPINKNARDFRAAENILLDWIRAHGIDDLEVMMKIGSLNNLGASDHNLTPSFIMMSAREYQNKFRDNLATLMIHWDNRNAATDIQETLTVLHSFQDEGLSIGFSGIKHPHVYAGVLDDVEFNNLRIQIKHNLLYSDHDRYAPLHTKASFIAYGINAGGLKLNGDRYKANASILARGGGVEQYQDLIEKINILIQETEQTASHPVPKRMNHLGLLNAFYHPEITQVLLGVSSVEQLEDTWKWVDLLSSVDYTKFYDKLQKLI